MIYYSNPQGVKVAFAELAGLQPSQVFFTNFPFELSPPPGVDWADYEEQEEGPPIRIPRPAWNWYREQYPQLAAEPPTPEAVAAWAPPEPEPGEVTPVTDVEKSTTNFLTAEELATKYLNALKGQVVVYLKTKRSNDEAVAAGVAFVDPDTGIGKEYDYFIKAGGHPLAAAKLYQRIQDVKGNFDWFDGQVNAILTAALTK